MDLRRLHEIYQIIQDRLPRKHPRANGMVIYPSDDAIVSDYDFAADCPYGLDAAMDLDTGRILLPIGVASEPDRKIANLILHELGHLYYAHKHGNDSSQANCERRANDFASRWVRVLVVEGLLD